ncbi:MAG: porin family protein [Bacteroides sp.]|nr:porin family protein [Bacteroides sp.]
MKKLFVFLAVLFCATYSFAQMKWGIEAGANLSRFVGSASLPSEKKAKPSMQIGITVDYELSAHWMLMSGLSFVQRHGELGLGENYPSSALGYEAYMRFPKVQSKINYGQIPLKVGYNFRLSRNFDLLPSMGLYAAYGFGAGSCDMQIKNQGKTQWRPLDGMAENGLKAFRSWDWGATAGIKAIWKQHYVLSVDYSLGIKKVSPDYGLRNSTYQLSVGYRF